MLSGTICPICPCEWLLSILITCPACSVLFYALLLNERASRTSLPYYTMLGGEEAERVQPAASHYMLDAAQEAEACL